MKHVTRQHIVVGMFELFKCVFVLVTNIFVFTLCRYSFYIYWLSVYTNSNMRISESLLFPKNQHPPWPKKYVVRLQWWGLKFCPCRVSIIISKISPLPFFEWSCCKGRFSLESTHSPFLNGQRALGHESTPTYLYHSTCARSIHSPLLNGQRALGHESTPTYLYHSTCARSTHSPLLNGQRGLGHESTPTYLCHRTCSYV